MSINVLSLPQQFNVRAEHEGWPAICDARLDFDSPQLVSLLGKWRGATLGLAVPRRSAITTRLLGAHLPEVAIVDYVESKAGPRRYRFRLQGRALANVRGDFGGKYVDAVVPPVLAKTWTFAFDTVLQYGAPLRFLALHKLHDRGPLKAESLMAPLCDHHGVPASVLTSVVYSVGVKGKDHGTISAAEAALAAI